MESRGPDIHQVEKSVFAVIGPGGATNFGIVRGSDGAALLIDADIRRVDEIEQAVKQAGCRRVRYLFNTHENFDHSSANHYFEEHGAFVIASDGCREALTDDGEAKFAEMAGRSPELYRRFAGLKMGLPRVTFGATGTVSLPGATIRLQYHGQSHSRGDATAFLEPGEILFAGDLLYAEVHPVTIYGDIPTWIRTLESLHQTRFKQIIPGHGPVPDGEGGGKESIRKLRGYLEDFYDKLLEVRSGRRGAEEVEAYMTSGAYEPLGKRWMVKRNIDYFLTGRRSALTNSFP